jgi:hypothetical protein
VFYGVNFRFFLIKIFKLKFQDEIKKGSPHHHHKQRLKPPEKVARMEHHEVMEEPENIEVHFISRYFLIFKLKLKISPPISASSNGIQASPAKESPARSSPTIL